MLVRLRARYGYLLRMNHSGTSLRLNVVMLNKPPLWGKKINSFLGLIN
jgi:hypothetical protein